MIANGATYLTSVFQSNVMYSPTKINTRIVGVLAVGLAAIPPRIGTQEGVGQ